MTPTLIERYQHQLELAWYDLRQELHEHLTRQYPLLAPLAPSIDGFLVKPGKFLRPSLVLFAYEVSSDTPANQTAIRLAISLELLHTYLLIHDDIMDRSDERRGGPSLHVRLTDDHKRDGRIGDSHHYGISAAILVGDILAGYAEAIWTDVTIGSAGALKLRPAFDALKHEVYAGQFFDIDLATRSTEVSLTDILTLAQAKTARYSIYRPLQIGFLLGQGSEPSWLAPFADQLGILYQITDDLLSTFGTKSQTGKSTDADIRERKLTILVGLAREQLQGHKAEQFEKYYRSKSSLTKTDINEVRLLLSDSGAIDAARRLATDYARQAQTSIHASDLADTDQRMLLNLVESILTREQ